MKKIQLLMMSTLLTTASYGQGFENSTNVGEARVHLLSEGQQKGNTSILIGATPEMIETQAPDGTFPNAVNAFLIQLSGKNMLVDAGFGKRLFDNLQTLDVDAEHIDIVLITHAHGDHIGGMLRDGEKAFPNAQVYMSQKEHDYWTSDAVKNNTVRQLIAVYKDQLNLFNPSVIGEPATPLIDGVTAIAAYGHTPGHTMYEVESKGEKLWIWGDLTHAMAVQMPYPSVAVTYDVDPAQAVKTRLEVLNYVSKNAIPIAGMHIAYPSTGAVVKEGDGYVFNPVEIKKMK
ncbi:MAG: MBL fold metallo-hydrolase [Candidatus Symbiothrix sp.]|jgi:glyoxylase-like metal-dependent hydrolase (beta-lactamase superfamily II)|nr:MBL fold metallo-hydrolase [Candidatus Symbiothrix sp.]